LSDTQLSVEIELPANYWPDNDVVSKLFENVDISLNHECVTRKSNQLDYAITNHFFQKVAYDDSYIASTMDANGSFDPLYVIQNLLFFYKTIFYSNVDSTEIEAKRVSSRTSNGIRFFKEVDHEGKVYLQPWVKYIFSVTINTGLARTTDCLPSNLPIVIRFHRAAANFSILRASNTLEHILKSDKNTKVEVPYTYAEDVVPILNPVLALYYAYSNELEQKMSRIKSSKIEIPFYDYATRRTVLDGGLSNYDVNLLQGDLPKYIIFALSSLERLNGSETLSLTKFVQGQLESFDLVLGKLVPKIKQK